MDQISFTNQVLCSAFRPNPFKRDLCKDCLNKIQAHGGAEERDIVAALEYAVDDVPSLILESRNFSGQLFVGGYKSGLNTKFLIDSGVILIVDTCPSLKRVLGTKYVNEMVSRDANPTVDFEYLALDWEDSKEQRLDPEQIEPVLSTIKTFLSQGKSVLIHCAQGKSRSVILTMAYLIYSGRCTTVPEALAWMKSHRQMFILVDCLDTEDLECSYEADRAGHI
eukprot:maker-scaffold1013_size70870-snap-gene-0.14 protein:Tk07032 transcript:maker-scaffold1013_size70870-snap-gene-0.14-mRNA-1 annotation:"dual specificity protein phosphatase 16-like"